MHVTADSTRRALRTVVQTVVGLAAVLPVVIAVVKGGLPVPEQVVSILASAGAAAGVVTKVWNLLEDKGLVPAWLK